MKKAVDMPTRLAASDQKDIGSGKYYAAQHQNTLHKSANNERIQDEFIKICKDISGVSFPKA